MKQETSINYVNGFSHSGLRTILPQIFSFTYTRTPNIMEHLHHYDITLLVSIVI